MNNIRLMFSEVVNAFILTIKESEKYLLSDKDPVGFINTTNSEVTLHEKIGFILKLKTTM